MKPAVRKAQLIKIREQAQRLSDTGEGLLTTNQQFVIMWLQTSLGGAWEGCQQKKAATLGNNNMDS